MGVAHRALDRFLSYKHHSHEVYFSMQIPFCHYFHTIRDFCRPEMYTIDRKKNPFSQIIPERSMYLFNNRVSSFILISIAMSN